MAGMDMRDISRGYKQTKERENYTIAKNKRGRRQARLPEKDAM